MQITSPRGKFVEKILCDSNGKMVRVAFCVYEVNGRIKARLLNVAYLKFRSVANKILRLGDSRKEQKTETRTLFKSAISSPYYELNSLSFLGSKPRAPAK